MQWEHKSAPEWVDGAGLANSDAVTTEMLSAFLDTVQIRWVSMQGTGDSDAIEGTAEQAVEDQSAEVTKEVEGNGSTEGTGGLPNEGVEGSDHVEPGELPVGESADVGGGIGGEVKAGVVTADTNAEVRQEGEVGMVGAEKTSQVAEGGNGSGARGIPVTTDPLRGEARAEAMEQNTAGGQPDSVEQNAPEIRRLGEAGSTGDGAGEEAKGMEGQESVVWATPTLSDINLLTVSWEGNITGDAVQVDECEDFVFQITS